MSDDLNKKLKQITDILGSDSMPENIKSLLALLAGGDSSADQARKTTEAKTEKPVEKNVSQDAEEDRQKVKKQYDDSSRFDEHRLNMLNSLKPFLNTSRQKKLTSCIRLLQLSKLSKLGEDLGKVGKD